MTNSIVINPDILRNRQHGICQFLHFTEENVRFVLLAIFLYIYLCLGATIFQAVEEPAEDELRASYELVYKNFIANLSLLNDNAAIYFYHDPKKLVNETEAVYISEQDLLQLMYAYGNASRAGAYGAKRWNWVGSFHFAWTIVSTIGYGATTPSTTAGQLLIIPYGFFGCAGGLLFFNLFLERIITFLASCMRYYRLKRQQRHSVYVFGDIGGRDNATFNGVGRRSSHSSAGNEEEEEVTDWKPSVYWVMICLLVMSSTIIFASAGMFHSMEGWTYIESLYFCFVSYATIGFGDFVSMQKISYNDYELVYRIAAFGTMVFGCCCLYSLLNVTSIVIKQNLNWLIKKIDYWKYCTCCTCLNRTLARKFSRKQRRRKRSESSRRSSNVATISVVKLRSITHQTSTGSSGGQNQPSHSHDHDIEMDMDERGRRYSSENMSSLRSELTNKVSLAVMQKRLYETAQMSRSAPTSHENDFSARSVGPLAIVTEKLGENNHHHLGK